MGKQPELKVGDERNLQEKILEILKKRQIGLKTIESATGKSAMKKEAISRIFLSSGENSSFSVTRFHLFTSTEYQGII